MRKGLKYLLFSVAVAMFVFAAAAVHRETRERRHEVTCNSISVSLRDSLSILGESDIISLINKDFPTFAGQRIDSIRLDRIEAKLNSSDAVSKAQAWVNDDGVLHVSVCQRDPVAKLVSDDGQYYLDADGFLFAVRGNCTKDIPVFKGHIPDRESPWFADMMEMLRYAKKHKLDRKIAFYEVDRNGEMALHPEEGKTVFIFGKPGGAPSKFAKMETYYKVIAPAKGEDAYSTVNLKYEGQIICRK